MLTQVLDYGNSFDYTYDNDPLSLQDWQRLLRAGKIAQKSDHRFRLGAVLTKGSRIYASSANKTKSHPKLFPNRMSVHAEMAVLAKVKDVKDTTVYVARLGQHSDAFRLALPCLYCIDAMRAEGVYRVVCTIDDRSATSFKLNSIRSEYLI